MKDSKNKARYVRPLLISYSYELNGSEFQQIFITHDQKHSQKDNEIYKSWHYGGGKAQVL